jgi:UDP-galactose transporter B1
MGRQKQTNPLQRTPSQSMRNEAEAAAEVSEKHFNGRATDPLNANTGASAKAVAALETVTDTPGIMQLLTCVLGIYAAL